MVDFGLRSNLKTIHQGQSPCIVRLNSGRGEHFALHVHVLGGKPLKSLAVGLSMVLKKFRSRWSGNIFDFMGGGLMISVVCGLAVHALHQNISIYQYQAIYFIVHK